MNGVLSLPLAGYGYATKGKVNSMKLPRHAEIWILPYLKDRLRKNARPAKPKRAWVAITDHYEPLGMGASVETALG
jgi:hypothetical protein